MSTKITFLFAVAFCLLSMTTKAQKTYLMAPLPSDKIIGTISFEEEVGACNYYKEDTKTTYSDGRVKYHKAGTREEDELNSIVIDDLHFELCASSEMDKRYPSDDKYELRNLNWSRIMERKIDNASNDLYDRYVYVWRVTATVVEPNGNSSSGSSSKSSKTSDPLSKALDRALQNIYDGSRIAVDQIRVTTDMDRNEVKDRVVELLLDKGFKVVAKDYLERLYEEQKVQQSGKYNDRTVAKSGNFTGVGYYLNVRYTDETIRVQVINVSTGEYEGNVTISL